MEAEGDEPTTSNAESGQPSAGIELTDSERRRLWSLAALPLFLVLLLYVGQISSGYLLSRAPLVLLALNASDPFLLLTAHEAPLMGFLIVGSIRLFLPDLFLYQIGHDYGPNTKSFLNNEFGEGNRLVGTIDWLERWFPKIGLILLFLIPGYPMCLLSGIARLNRALFVFVNLAGTFTRLTVVWWVSSVFEGPVGTIVRGINRYSLPFTIAMIALVVMQARRQASRAQ